MAFGAPWLRVTKQRSIISILEQYLVTVPGRYEHRAVKSMHHGNLTLGLWFLMVGPIWFLLGVEGSVSVLRGVV